MSHCILNTFHLDSIVCLWVAISYSIHHHHIHTHTHSHTTQTTQYRFLFASRRCNIKGKSINEHLNFKTFYSSAFFSSFVKCGDDSICFVAYNQMCLVLLYFRRFLFIFLLILRLLSFPSRAVVLRPVVCYWCHSSNIAQLLPPYYKALYASLVAR